MKQPMLPEGCRERACQILNDYISRGLSNPAVFFESLNKLKEEYPDIPDKRAIAIIQFYQDQIQRGNC